MTANRDQLLEILETVVRLASDGTDRLDLKIANAALKEMCEGFEVFAPYRHVRKVTMFGSARTLPTDPLYAQARDLAALLAAHGWSTVTGAGPGIMAAGLEGAGPDHAFGINIRLPFEQGANEFIAKDPKLVSMKYFFTRKLLLIKESFGYAVLPGGFGTLDEAFELLTLIQTGQGRAGAGGAARDAGRQLLEGLGALRHRGGGLPRPHQPRRHLPVPHRRSGRGRRRRDPRASTATTTRCAGSATRW